MPKNQPPPISLRLPVGLLERLDAARQAEQEQVGVDISRNAWIVRACERQLQAAALAEELAEAYAAKGGDLAGGVPAPLVPPKPPARRRQAPGARPPGDFTGMASNRPAPRRGVSHDAAPAEDVPAEDVPLNRISDEVPASVRERMRRGKVTGRLVEGEELPPIHTAELVNSSATASDMATAEVTGSFTTTSTLGAARTPEEAQRQLGEAIRRNAEESLATHPLLEEAEASVALDGDTHSMSEEEWAAYSAASAREAGHDPEATLGPDTYVRPPTAGAAHDIPVTEDTPLRDLAPHELPEVGDREDPFHQGPGTPTVAVERPVIRVVRVNAGPFWRWDAVDENGEVLAGGSCPGKRDVPTAAKERLTALFGHDAFDVKVSDG